MQTEEIMQATIDSDSNSFEANDFFEGVEKLLEIWFGRGADCPDGDHRLVSVGTGSVDILRRSSDGEEDDKSGDDDIDVELDQPIQENDDDGSAELDGPNKLMTGSRCNKRVVRREGDLRRIPKQAIQDMLALVKCEIISGKQSEHIDAYVLSESSLFVSRNRIILKTCGSTVLLRCVKPLLYLAKKYAGFDQVSQRLFFRRSISTASEPTLPFIPPTPSTGAGRVLLPQELHEAGSAGEDAQQFQLRGRNAGVAVRGRSRLLLGSTQSRLLLLLQLESGRNSNAGQFGRSGSNAGDHHARA
jgi:hypothetical protein